MTWNKIANQAGLILQYGFNVNEFYLKKDQVEMLSFGSYPGKETNRQTQMENVVEDGAT